MYRRVIALLGLVAVLMAVAVAANAEELADEGGGSAEGRGWVWAKGTGTAILEGQGKVDMAIDGDVVIYDYAGDAVVEFTAVPEDGAGAEQDGLDVTTTYTLDNFRGRIHVAGSDFRIEAEGTMRFRAHGEGMVQVEGQGRWWTTHQWGIWDGTVRSLAA